jgi:hypothetical protein
MKISEYFQFLPLLGSYLIFCSLGHIFAYYYGFGFNPLPFVDLSEVLLLSLAELFMYALLLLFFIWLFTFPIKSNDGLDDTEYQKRQLSENSIFKRWYNYFSHHGWFKQLFFFFSFFAIILVGAHFRQLDTTYVTPIVLFLFVAFITSLFIAEYEVSLFRRNEQPKRIYLDILRLCILFFVFDCMFSYRHSMDVQRNHLTYGVHVRLSDRVIVSDSTTYFIGKTAKYVFVFDASRRAVSVVPGDQIKGFDFPSQ